VGGGRVLKGKGRKGGGEGESKARRKGMGKEGMGAY